MLPVKLSPFGISVKRLPYDREVEYLESTGTQYLNTEVILNPTLIWEIDGQFTVLATSDQDAQQMGIIQATDSGNFRVILGNQSGVFNWFVGPHSQIFTQNTKRHTWSLDMVNHRYGQDSTIINYASFTATGTFTRPLYLMARCEANEVAGLFCKMKLFTSKITENSTLVRDFIPVRTTIEGKRVGAMYDRANPNGGPNGNGMYYNQGSGDFIIGPDI